MDERMYPQGSKLIDDDRIETSPTSTDLVEVTRGNKKRLALTLANLFRLHPEIGRLKVKSAEITADGAVAADVTLVQLNKAGGALAVTIPAPEVGRVLVITQIDAGTAGHTVTLTSGTWDGSGDVATFDAAGETLVVIGLSATRFLVLVNLGAVAFTSS